MQTGGLSYRRVGSAGPARTHRAVIEPHRHPSLFNVALIVLLLFPSTGLLVAPERDRTEINHLQIITFNTGLAEKYSFDLVPAVKLRWLLQREVLEKELHDQDQDFILLLQEVWKEKYALGFAEMARNLGASISRTDVRGRGLMIVTSGKIIAERFQPFPCDTYSRWGNRRGLLSAVCVFECDTILAVTTHTAFSTAKRRNQCHRRQLAFIADFCDSLSQVKVSHDILILGGDFNCGGDLRYRDQSYDPVAKIWTPFWKRLELSGWQHASLENGVTWDPVRNPLILHPAKILWKQLKWEELSCSLDHIFLFAGPDSKYAAGPRPTSNLVLDQPLDYPRSYDKWYVQPGKGYLSDHFGVETTLTCPGRASHRDD